MQYRLQNEDAKTHNCFHHVFPQAGYRFIRERAADHKRQLAYLTFLSTDEHWLKGLVDFIPKDPCIEDRLAHWQLDWPTDQVDSVFVAQHVADSHATMTLSDGFGAFLAPRLAEDNRLRVHHLSTPPILCSPLFVPGPSHTAGDKTWCETHFLAISQQPTATEVDSGSRILVLGLEVLIFTSENLTTIFVSKADSTGYLFRHPVSSNRTSVALATTSAFLEYLVRPRLTCPRLVLSLFARSQNQYLFPGSIENESKRILDDRQLIKWWCRVLDPIVRSRFDLAKLNTKAYVVVPGCEKTETRAFFPPSARSDSPTEAKWESQYPVSFLTRDASLPPRCLIPRLPDDPKARFLDDLDGARVNDDGSWKDVKSLDQFWEMMSYRQECAAGRLVGFIWATFSQPTEAMNEAEFHISGLEDVTGQPSTGSEGDLHASTKDETTLVHQARSSHHTQHSVGPSEADNPLPPSWPVPTRGQLILMSDSYASLMDHLLQLDFAGEGTAKQSTASWIDQAKKLVSATDFGVDVEGRLILQDVQPTTDRSTPVTNVLTAVRKKRKVAPTEPTAAVQDLPSNTLDPGAVRKKPKA